MIKAYEEYQDGTLCGIVFKAKYIDKSFPEITSAAMRLGHYFEYLVTGQLPRDGKEPHADYTKTGLKKPEQERTTQDMLAPYKLAVINAERTKGYISSMGLIVESTGVSVSENGMSGIYDIYGDLGGNKVIVDLKYSGLLQDKYNKMGWGALQIDGYYGEQQRKHHSVQAIHYSKIWNVDEFYYLVVSSSNDKDVELFKFTFSDKGLQAHERRVEQAREGIELGKTIGFTAHPTVSRCASCPWGNKCKASVKYPIPKVITVTSDEIWKT
jgi:hypothetical protein